MPGVPLVVGGLIEPVAGASAHLLLSGSRFLHRHLTEVVSIALASHASSIGRCSRSRNGLSTSIVRSG